MVKIGQCAVEVSWKQRTKRQHVVYIEIAYYIIVLYSSKWNQKQQNESNKSGIIWCTRF